MTKIFERRANEPLLRALEPGGFAHLLVDYAQSGMYGFDLQFRRGSGSHHATLYVGTTKALDLHANTAGKYKLAVHTSYAQKKLLWHPSWTSWHTEAQIVEEWPSIEQFLDRVIGHIAEQGTHLKEGVVQAAVMRSPLSPFTTIDREVAISYSNQPEKDRALRASSKPWLDAGFKENAPAWWNSSRPTKPSTECDILGLSRRGQLLAIEIKPASAGAAKIAWAPLQARQYATQIQSWVDEKGDTAAENLSELMRQQQRIGMRRSGALPRIDLSKPVRPVVVVDSRLGAQARARMFEVIEHLRETGMDPGVEVRLTNVIGRLTDPITE